MIKLSEKKHFDYLILNLFLKENIEFLQSARIQKIQQPTRQEVIFWLRNHGESKKFYININPNFFHVCFISKENENKRMFEIREQNSSAKNSLKPQKSKRICPPPMFCMLLRKYLESTKIVKVIQPEKERILEFYFEAYNEIGEQIYLCLAIELMGKHSNIILYNYDTNVIIGCAHNVGSDKSRERELIGGLPYTYPSKSTVKVFSGLSDLLPDKVSINDFIDNYFANMQQEEKIKALKSKLLTTTKTKLRKINSSLEKIKKQSKGEKTADLYRKKGDLIMGVNKSEHNNFLKEIELLDWETNTSLKIKLDETKTLKENANEYYKLYKKAKTANLKTEEMVESLNIDQEHLEQTLYSIENAQTAEELTEINEEDKNILPKKEKSLKNLSDYILKITIKSFTVFIGKNNKQNDYIVSKLARDEDLWFHTHNCAGSHVLLRIDAGQSVTDEIIFECAKLAKEYSSAKLSSKVGVIYTRAKNLKKPPAAPLGYVIYKNEKEIIIN